jgi:hypothetical protein
MFRSTRLQSAVLLAAAWWATASAAHVQLPVADEELLKRLDPLIVNAVKPDATDTPLRKLQKGRCRERAVALAKLQAAMENKKWDPTAFSESLSIFNQFTENLKDLIAAPADQVRCYELRVEFLKSVEAFVSDRVKDGEASPRRSDLARPQHLNLARAARADAEIELLQFKERIEKLKK